MGYPDDGNGAVLRRMQRNGDDLTLPRNIDFAAVFPSEDAAQQFANHFRALGYETSVDLTRTDEEFPWDVVVVKHMVPTHDAIGSFEDSLQDVANTFGGRNDGWGCLSERKTD